MAIDVDGFSLLRSILDNRHAFPDIAAEVNKAARGFVVGQLKAKTTSLGGVRAIYAVIGSEAFALTLDGVADPAIAALAKKIDKNNPELASGSGEWRRRRITELARGAADPVEKAAKAAKAAKTSAKTAPKEKAAKSARVAKPKVERALNSKAMAAKWDGKDRDD